MSADRSLIAPTSKPLLEGALKEKLQRRAEATGSLGELEPLAIRLGLMQNTLKPRFRDPQLVVFAADHGLAVDGLAAPQRKQTHEQVAQLLTGQLPVSVFARIQGLELSVVDCGVAEMVAPHDRLIRRKIAHGTRNSRVGLAMSVDQAHAAIRAGMEIGDTLRGNLVAVAGIGVGAHESAALVLVAADRHAGARSDRQRPRHEPGAAQPPDVDRAGGAGQTPRCRRTRWRCWPRSAASRSR